MPKMHFHVINGLAGGYVPNDNWATDEADTAFEGMIEYADNWLDGLYMMADEDDTLEDEIHNIEDQIQEMKDLWAEEETHDMIIRSGAMIVLDRGNYYVEMEPCMEADCEVEDDG